MTTNPPTIHPMRRYAVSLVGLVLVAAAYGATRYSMRATIDPANLAARFAFERHPMPELPDRAYQNVRVVAPCLKRIDGWISAVGAAVTLADLDGDGLSNDLIWVDPRTDLVTVAPVPTTQEPMAQAIGQSAAAAINFTRYPPFALSASPLTYDHTMAPMGSVAGDLNEDGLMDVLVLYWGRPPIAFLRKPGTSTLSSDAFVAREIVSFERWFTSCAALTDLDGDGHLDLVVGNYFQDGGRILDPDSPDIEVMHDTKSKSFNGGWNRILRFTAAAGGENPTVTYEDVQGVLTEELARGWTLALGAADLDGDMLPEIYFANDFGPDRLLHNRSTPGNIQFAVLEGRRDFTTPKSCVLGQDSFKGMGCDFGDVNDDGRMDIFVSNIAAPFALHESHFLWESTGNVAQMKKGIAPYVNASERCGVSRSGWGWDAKMDDLDNDGTLEIFQATGFMKGTINRWPELQSLGTGNDQMIHDPRHWPAFRPGDDVSGHDPNAFFVRGPDGCFHDIARYIGLGEPWNSRGIATADVDGDGRLDFALANQFEPSYFFKNQSPEAGDFLGLHLLLPRASESTRPFQSNIGHPDTQTGFRPAVGAIAVVHLPDGRKLIRLVDGGNGYTGRRSPDIHFGLGKLPVSTRQTALRVDLRWRDLTGNIQTTTVQLAPGWHTIVLGVPARPVPGFGEPARPGPGNQDVTAARTAS